MRDVERSDDRVFWESAQQFEHIEDLIKFFSDVRHLRRYLTIICPLFAH